MAIPVIIKRSLIAQFVLCFIFVISGLIVCTLQTFTVLVWPINKNLYRRVNCKLVYLHWTELVFLCDYWAEVELHWNAEPGVWEKVGTEHGLLVLNHRCTLDFMIAWMLGERAGFIGNTKAVVIDWCKFLPFIGWSLVLLEYIFVSKDPTKNRNNVVEGFKTYGSYPVNCVTMIFCEGSRFSEYDHDKSKEYAKKLGIEPLRHLLLPRTKGFAMAIDGLKGSAPAMYDCCIGYDTNRGAKPTLENLMQGKKMIFHITCRRVLIDDIPNTTEKECDDYCYDMYQKKDEEYDYFTNNNTFDGYDSTRKHQILHRKKGPLIVVIFWMLLICVPTIFYVGMIVFYGSMWARALLALAVLTIHVFLQVFVWFSRRNLPKKSSASHKAEETSLHGSKPVS